MFNQCVKTILLPSLLLLSTQAAATWQIDNDHSRVNFVSVKNNMVAENHHFKTISGTLSKQGQFLLDIELGSVETNIPIRNERMQKFLFNIADFPTMKVSADVQALLQQVKTKGWAQAPVEATLVLNGKTKVQAIDLIATMDKKNKIVVSSLTPVLVNPADYGLSQGIDKLQEIAGLQSITRAVPVSFVLTLNDSQ
ncbi:YceI family protein [Pseudoalteromonas sp. SSDWG2]|uniref:YceI family protein n=1 Tax=Pseudoalteromonas sp. SSDWG2 TaxID=3139391 RepID=UPI003BA8D0D0